MFPLWLTFLIIAAALFAVGGLTTTVWTTLKFGRRRRFAPASGIEWQGVRYALFEGMMPWAKESVRQHLLTWCAGIVYHLGIAAAFCVVIMMMISVPPEGTARLVCQTLMIAGAACGIGLLVKRAVSLALRAISTLDDVISNLLVTIFLVLVTLTLSFPKLSVAMAIEAALLLLYIPLGKIRHCFLFFLSRITFGKFFGRRNVLPHRTDKVRESHVS